MRRLLADRIKGATRLALTEDGQLTDFSLMADAYPPLRESIWLARVTDVIPSIGAAFLDLGTTSAMLNYKGKAPVVGEALVVQISADAPAGKDARASTHIRLFGRFTIYEPGGEDISAAHSIRDRAVKAALVDACPKGLDGHVTLRSRAAGLVERGQVDVMTSRLQAQADHWRKIKEDASRLEPPCCLLPAPTPLELAVRDGLDAETEIVVSEPGLLKQMHQALEHIAPDITTRPKLVADADLFEDEGIADAIAWLAEPIVPLKGGGRIQISETPAVVAIDVDSGSARSWVPGRTADAVNAEAAKVIAAQVRLRQLAGTVVVDFIGFDEHVTKALAALRAALQDDPLSSRPTGVGGVGIAVFTRRRLGPSLGAQFARLKED